MNRILFGLLLIAIASSANAQNQPPNTEKPKQKKATGYDSRNSTTLSMMGWGITIAVGMAAICAAIDNHGSSGSSSTNNQ